MLLKARPAYFVRGSFSYHSIIAPCSSIVYRIFSATLSLVNKCSVLPWRVQRLRGAAHEVSGSYGSTMLW